MIITDTRGHTDSFFENNLPPRLDIMGRSGVVPRLPRRWKRCIFGVWSESLGPYYPDTSNWVHALPLQGVAGGQHIGKRTMPRPVPVFRDPGWPFGSISPTPAVGRWPTWLGFWIVHVDHQLLGGMERRTAPRSGWCLGIKLRSAQIIILLCVHACV